MRMDRLLATAVGKMACMKQLLAMLFVLMRFPYQAEGSAQRALSGLLESLGCLAHETQSTAVNLSCAVAEAALSARHWPMELAQTLRRLCSMHKHPEIQLGPYTGQCMGCQQALPTAGFATRGGTCHTRYEGKLRAEIMINTCSRCKTKHYPSFWETTKRVRYFFPHTDKSFFMPTASTAFETCFLEEMEAHVHRNHASYRLCRETTKCELISTVVWRTDGVPKVHDWHVVFSAGVFRVAGICNTVYADRLT